MKKLLCIILCVTTVFSSLCFSVAANEIDYNSIQGGEVAFDCGYADVGTTLNVTVGGEVYDKLVYRWYIDGTLIENNSSAYTVLDCDMQSMIAVDVFDINGNEIGSTSMFLSNLPVVYIDTENGAPIVSKENYINANIKIQGNDEFASEKVLYDGEAEIRGRGNSTWNADKKPYKIKLGSKSDLLGMGKNKHWVLLSNPFDTSLMKNHLAYNLAADMGLDYQKSEWVEVVLNGYPVGNYQLCEHIRIGENRVDITDWESLAEDAAKAIYNENKSSMTKDERDELIDIMTEDMSWTTSNTVKFKGVTYVITDFIDFPEINGGYLTEIVRSVEGYTFSTKGGLCVDVDTPEALSEDMLNYIRDYYQAFEDALFSEDFCTQYKGTTKRYTDFIDLESFVKGFLVNELFENFDFGRTSTWIYQEVGGKLVYGPVWDMDNTLTSTTFFRWTSLNITWLKRLLSDPVFVEELRKTYFQYRYTAIQDILKDSGDIDKAIQKITTSAEYNDKIWVNKTTFAEYSSNLRLRLQAKVNWFDQVLSTLDKAYASMAYGIQNMQYVNSDNIVLKFDKQKNQLTVNIYGTVPASAKIFANGKLCGNISSPKVNQTVTLSKITSGAVISLVCYDSDGKVVSGKCLSTLDEVTKLEITNLPEKLTYNAGEEINLDSLVLTATNSVSGAQTVKPDLVYTYVKDSIGEKLFSYGKVTEEIGETYVVLRYKNACVEYKINVNPRENYEEVIDLIANLPSKTASGRFTKEMFEAQVAFDALTAEAQAKVYNKDVLANLFADLEANADTAASVVAVDTDSVFHTNARSNIIIVSKDTIKKLVLAGPDSSSATYEKDSQAYLTEKKVGNYTVTTIKHMIPSDTSRLYLIKAIYNDGRTSDPFEVTVQDFVDMSKDIEYIDYDLWVNKGEDYTVGVQADNAVKGFRLCENGTDLGATVKASGNTVTLTTKFSTAGNHKITLEYLIDGSWVEYRTLDVYVREFISDKKRIYGIEYPTETYSKKIPVNIYTSSDITSMRLVCEDITVRMVPKNNGGLKFWSATIDITNNKEYVLYLGQQKTQTVISATILDSFEIVGTKLVKFLADTDTAEVPERVTEIADNAFEGFDGKIICYPGSAAEAFAKKKGIDYETYSFSANIKEIEADKGESFRIEITATPFMPADFELVAQYNSNIISVDGNTVKTLNPGYSRLILSSKYSSFTHTAYVSVGGGPRRGDISADTKINSFDALMVLQSSVQSITLSPDEFKAADISEDGKVNSMDALLILQIATGKHTIWDYV